MSLIEEIKTLRELEHPNRIDRVEYGAAYQYHVSKLAPAMLEVLGMIREGDAEKLSWLEEFFTVPGSKYSDLAEVLTRIRKMAALMEKEVQP